MATAAAALLHPRLNYCIKSPHLGFGIWIKCSDSASSNPKQGFGPKSRRTNNKKLKSGSPQQSSTPLPNQAPVLSSSTGRKMIYTSTDDLEFEKRLQAVRKSALEQKKTEEGSQDSAIDYDAPTETNGNTIGLGTKIGVGVAVIVFGLVFALGDFLPTGSPTKEPVVVENKISDEERAIFEKRLDQFEQTLAISPEDSTALEGAAVTLTQMREYKRAATLLEKLSEKRPSDPDTFRLLGEVKYELKDYEGSVAAYKSAAKASQGTDFEVLRGITNALLGAKRPDEAVQVLLASRERLSKENSDVDPIQVDLLLGKAYSDWGHISDAVSVYDQLISTHPDDFRGYLAKGIILKGVGSVGDAERMFIQARFFAPDKAKVLVDKYSR